MRLMIICPRLLSLTIYVQNVVRLNTRTLSLSQLLSPLVGGRANNVLLQTVPGLNEVLLQLVDIVHTAV